MKWKLLGSFIAIGLVIGVQDISAGYKAIAAVLYEVGIADVTVMWFPESIGVSNPSEEKTIIGSIADAPHDIYLNLMKFESVLALLTRPKGRKVDNSNLTVLIKGIGHPYGNARIERYVQHLDTDIGPIGGSETEIFEHNVQRISGKSAGLWSAGFLSTIRTVDFDDCALASMKPDIRTQLTLFSIGTDTNLFARRAPYQYSNAGVYGNEYNCKKTNPIFKLGEVGFFFVVGALGYWFGLPRRNVVGFSITMIAYFCTVGVVVILGQWLFPLSSLSRHFILSHGLGIST